MTQRHSVTTSATVEQALGREDMAGTLAREANRVALDKLWRRHLEHRRAIDLAIIGARPARVVARRIWRLRAAANERAAGRMTRGLTVRELHVCRYQYDLRM